MIAPPCRRPLRRAISLERMGHKDAGAKQAQKRSDCFNHLTLPFLLLRVTVTLENA